MACGKREIRINQISDVEYLYSLKYLTGRNGVQTGDKGAPQKAQPPGELLSLRHFLSLQQQKRDDIARVLFFHPSEADVPSDGECVIAAKRHESSSLHWQLYYMYVMRDKQLAGCQEFWENFI